MSKRLIYEEDAIDALMEILDRPNHAEFLYTDEICKALKELPSTQPEIIRCNVCRHWHQTTGEMKEFGLGDCDYLEKKLVTCNGYCYWAERKEDE